MRPVKPYCLVLFGVLLVIVTGACTPGGTPIPVTFTVARPEDTTSPPTQVPPAATAPPEDTIPPPTQAPPTHRIGVRTVDSVGEFYDRATGERFVPRGNNLVRLAWQKGFNGESFFYHSNFNVGLYDPVQAELSLREMHEQGYNVVRVFIQGACRNECLGDPSGGLTSAYVANVAAPHPYLPGHLGVVG